MRSGTLVAIVCLVVLVFGAAPAFAKDDLPTPHGDDVVKAALERFEKDFAEDDLDDRIQILRWLGRHRHKDVEKRLEKIWLREKNLELVAAAGEGLGYQVSTPKRAGKALFKGLLQYKNLAGKSPVTDEERLQEDLEASVLVNGIQSLGKLAYAADWKKMRGFIDHNNDDVAIAMIDLCAAQKEYRAIPIIYEWFSHYPDGVSWSGGSVKVDTGGGGNKDRNAAKAKWKAKYGGRAKKSRPDAFAAMVSCVKVLTGQEIKKREELKAWMDENKAFLKKHGV
jgi:hypothetical protein